MVRGSLALATCPPPPATTPPQVNANEDEALQGTDLTFEGAYVPGNSTYIVHVIGLPFIPKGTNLKLDDDGPCPCASSARAFYV